MLQICSTPNGVR